MVRAVFLASRNFPASQSRSSSHRVVTVSMNLYFLGPSEISSCRGCYQFSLCYSLLWSRISSTQEQPMTPGSSLLPACESCSVVPNTNMLVSHLRSYALYWDELCSSSFRWSTIADILVQHLPVTTSDHIAFGQPFFRHCNKRIEIFPRYWA